MHPSSEQDGSTDSSSDLSSSDTWSSDTWSSDLSSSDTTAADRPSGTTTDVWTSDPLGHHLSVIHRTGWHRPRQSMPMPRTPLGWAAWAVGVGVSLLVAGVIYSSGPGGGGPARTGPVDASIVRAGASSACGVPVASVSAPSRWSHSETSTPMDDGTMSFYDVPVDDGGEQATAIVVLANYGDGWEDAGGQCDR